MDRKNMMKNIYVLFAVLALLCSCSNKEPKGATPTPFTVPYTAQPTVIALPDDAGADIPSLEQMKAQVKQGLPWYVRVDACNQLVSVYAKDENKKYTYLVNRFICSVPIGISPLLLQTGKNMALAKFQWEQAPGDGDYYCEFTINVEDKIAFRSVPLMNMNRTMMNADVYNQLSLPTDNQYIVLSPDDAEWMFDNLLQGALIEIVYDSPDPDLVQSFMPMPYIEGLELPPDHDEFEVCITQEPIITWGNLYSSTDD